MEEVRLDEGSIRRAGEKHLSQEGGERSGEENEVEQRKLLEHGEIKLKRVGGLREGGRQYQLGREFKGMDLRRPAAGPSRARVISMGEWTRLAASQSTLRGTTEEDGTESVHEHERHGSPSGS